MGEKNEVNHDKKAFAAATSCEATINNTPKMKETFGVREWFSSLSEDDRIVALAFIDKSFLDTLSQVATHLSAIGGRNMTTDRRSTEG